jgi:SAM-dependent methyltransferase
LRRLDLGCGTKRRPGFIGLDRYDKGGAHVIADLDGAHLPFADDSFDLVLAFHSMEHVRDLMATMREVWRVGRPGAQVCIVAPYYTMGLNLANPYHKQVFNEHTPRFWTDAPQSGLDSAEWQQPPLGGQWGLASSDHSSPGFDLRCLRVEFFYFQEYWGQARPALRRARRERLDVCEQIAYHLLVFKPPLTEAEAGPRAAGLELFMPPELEERRAAALKSVRTGVLGRLRRAPAGLLARLLRRFA